MHEVNRHQENETRPVEEKSEVFDEKLFEEVLKAISDLESYEPEVPEHRNLEFIKENAHLFAPALARESSAFAAFMGLKKLAEHYEVVSSVEEDPYDNDITEFAMNTICKLLPDIDKSAQNRTGLSPQFAIQLYAELIEKGNDVQKDLGAYFLSKHLPVIKKGLADPKTFLAYRKYVEGMLEFGGPVYGAVASEMVVEFIDECKNDDQFFSMVHLMMKSNDVGLILKAEEIIENELTTVGLPYQELLKDWERSEKPKEGIFAKWVNFKAIKEIEKKKKGGCEFLHKEFGISDFGRYPPELLLKQIEEAESKENPYGVVIFPRDDWNGAFYADADVFRKLDKQLDGEFSLRFFECESKADIARALIKSNKRYNPPDGSGHKISLLILGGHGSEKRINFGGDEHPSERHYLTADDLMGGGVKKAGQFFEENPTIILSSCSTGAEGGIGQELSKRFGAKVIAPKEPTALTGIYASKNRGQDKFRFNAEYSSRGSKKLYKSGGQLKK